MNGIKPKDNQQQTGILSKALKVAAYPVAAVTGYWVTAHDVFNSVFKDIKEHKIGVGKTISEGASDARTQYEIDKAALIEEGLKAHLDKTPPPKDLAIRKKAINTTYRKAIGEELKGMGLGNTSKRWTWIHSGDRQHALINGLTAAGIALGALLAISSTKTLNEAFKKSDDKGEGPSI